MSIKRETVAERKALPLASGVLDYFPDALLVVAEVSRVGNEQHHPGEPLHWDKSKSTDEADALLRHLLDRGTLDTDGLRHSGKVAWRALAMLQRELDAEAAAAEPAALKARALASIAEATAEFERIAGPDAPAPLLVEGTSLSEDGEPYYGMPLAQWHGYGHEVPSEEWKCPCHQPDQYGHAIECPLYR